MGKLDKARLRLVATAKAKADNSPSWTGRSHRKGAQTRAAVGVAGLDPRFLEDEGVAIVAATSQPTPSLWADELTSRDGRTCGTCGGLIKVEAGRARAVCLLCGRESVNPHAHPSDRMLLRRVDAALRPLSGECRSNNDVVARVTQARKMPLEAAA